MVRCTVVMTDRFMVGVGFNGYFISFAPNYWLVWEKKPIIPDLLLYQ